MYYLWARYLNRLPHEVDELPWETVVWLTNQLLEHESNADEWWKRGGFDFDDLGVAPEDGLEWRGPRMTLPSNWEQIPMEAD